MVRQYPSTSFVLTEREPWLLGVWVGDGMNEQNQSGEAEVLPSTLPGPKRG